MGVSKIGLGVTAGILALGFTGAANAQQNQAFVKTVTSEVQCTAQDGNIIDLYGAKHCLVPVIPKEFQDVQYAGELRGVTECPEKATRTTPIGDVCVSALEPIPAKPAQASVVEDAIDKN